ncbi:MAG: DUF3343 domain-containing protein [Clostridia bacterium]|nr:DUF3343 domain-containing protein [Clostridia bacterium]
MNYNVTDFIRRDVPMNCVFFIVSSVTYAMKAKNALERHGIPCRVEKIKNVASLGGCGFGIKVPKDYLSVAKNIFFSEGINIAEITDCGAKYG